VQGGTLPPPRWALQSPRTRMPGWNGACGQPSRATFHLGRRPVGTSNPRGVFPMRFLSRATLGGVLCLSRTRAAHAIKAEVAAKPARASEAATTSTTSTADTATSQMQVFIDPETGLRVSQPVTIEQRRAAESGMGMRATGPVEEIHHPDGMV